MPRRRRRATPCGCNCWATTPVSTATRSWSNDRGQAREPESLAAGAAGPAVRRLLRAAATDDGGELFGAGHHLARAPRVRGHGVVRAGDARRGTARRAVAPARVLAGGAGRGNPAGRAAG